MTSGAPSRSADQGVDASSRVIDGENANSALWLRCRVGNHHFALPMADIIETMRMLPVETVAGAPAIVRGLCVVRGAPIPIVDTALLFDERATQYERIVTARVANSVVGFAADAVIDVRSIPAHAMQSLPALFRDVDAVSAMTMLDEELLFFLQTARAIPEDFFADMDHREADA